MALLLMCICLLSLESFWLHVHIAFFFLVEKCCLRFQDMLCVWVNIVLLWHKTLVGFVSITTTSCNFTTNHHIVGCLKRSDSMIAFMIAEMLRLSEKFGNLTLLAATFFFWTAMHSFLIRNYLKWCWCSEKKTKYKTYVYMHLRSEKLL